MSKGERLNLNIKFRGDKVTCAKSPSECNNCKDKNRCENFNVYLEKDNGIQTLNDARVYRRVNGRRRQVR